MRYLRKPALVAALAAGAFGVAQSATAESHPSRNYVVVYEQGQSAKAAHEAIDAAGGKLIKENAKIGVATVASKDPAFIRHATAQRALLGAASDRPIGHTPGQGHARWRDVERAGIGGKGRGHKPSNPAPADEPLAALQWDMKMIGATSQGSYRKQPGSKAVRVGIIDTGVDASHPDIAPNFDFALSRNFTTDRPDIDGPCEDEPDQSCNDAATTDEGGHGTHVAGTVAAALNGIGIAGVAPKVDIVNLRGGQDSGYFFLQPTLDALTYAGDHGIDVVNMSYYIDPWLYNCAANPADSPAEQAEQRTVIAATQRALDYARHRGVTLVAAEGNGHTDLGNPKVDDTSPDYPVDENGDPAAARHRDIDNSCISMPTEGKGVIGVTSVGPSGNKAYYSDYGLEQADVAAPGGDVRDNGPGKPYGAPSTVYSSEILSTYPAALAREEGLIDDQGNSASPSAIVDHGAVYVYLQGTSMASPHAVGVAALIVSEYGKKDRRHGGLTLDPATVERIMKKSATDHACPDPRSVRYDRNGDGTIQTPAESQYDATCEGGTSFNGFYGEGIVNALAAVGGDKHGHGHGYGRRHHH
jgi:lantibiotic leader peptide-processing serine protease